MSPRITASPKLSSYVVLAGLGLLFGAVLGRPEAVAIGLAFLVPVVAALGSAAGPPITVPGHHDRARVIEDESVGLTLEVEASGPVSWLHLHVPVADALEATGGHVLWTVALSGATPRTLTAQLRARRWGDFRIDWCHLAARDPLGLFAWETVVPLGLALRAFPHEEVLARAITPADTQLFAGNEVSRRMGEGLEFALVRPHAPGDRANRINWTVTTRLGELHVNEQHPERNTDVVLFLDTFSDVGDDAASTLLSAVRGASAVARHYLGRHDRVGLVSFGGILRWLLPGMGTAHLYRVLDALLDSQTVMSYAWKDIDVIPLRTLPPKALVIAITPLLDQRTITTLFGLRARGFDLAILEVSPETLIPPVRDNAADENAALALRLWRLKREALREDYQRAGVPVTTWRGGESLAVALEEVHAFRRFARRASGSR